jgi:hypothetical protein
VWHTYIHAFSQHNLSCSSWSAIEHSSDREKTLKENGKMNDMKNQLSYFTLHHFILGKFCNIIKTAWI